ncbi:hypothetical protein [Micromonospora chersina]|uniref:hypothetical protein n=1 Tax=Micromonospora chersina TaxID=47854 RepID=UPI00371F26E1
MRAEDAHIAGLVGVEDAQPRLSGMTLLVSPWSPQKRGSHSAVTDLDDKRDHVVGGGTDWQFLDLKSSPLSFVPVHGQYRGLRLVREEHAVVG